jgi:hypothetical protein
MRMTLCEVHEKQANALGKTHVSFACPFCLIDSSVKAESQLALAREGLQRIVDEVREEALCHGRKIAQQILAKLAQAKP